MHLHKIPTASSKRAAYKQNKLDFGWSWFRDNKTHN